MAKYLFPGRCALPLAAVILFFSLQPASAQSDFSAFWKNFKSAVIRADKSAVAEMTKFPLSFYSDRIQSRTVFLRRYEEIFHGECNAAQCFGSVEPRKTSAQQYEIYCPFKATPKDMENAPIRFIFERTKTGWKFIALDNINE